jgi:hypothetical protein
MYFSIFFWEERKWEKNVREGGVAWRGLAAWEKLPPRDCRAPADLSSAPLATVSFYRSIGKTAGVPDAVKEALR